MADQSDGKPSWQEIACEVGLGPSRKFVVAFGLGDSVLPNLVEQGFVANLQQRRRLLAVPVGLLERLPDGFSLSFILGGARQRFQSPARVSGFRRGIRSRAAAVAVIAGLQFSDSEVLVAKDQVALEKVIQLPQISRPRMRLAGLEQLRRKRKRRPRIALGHA